MERFLIEHDRALAQQAPRRPEPHRIGLHQPPFQRHPSMIFADDRHGFTVVQLRAGCSVLVSAWSRLSGDEFIDEFGRREILVQPPPQIVIDRHAQVWHRDRQRPPRRSTDQVPGCETMQRSARRRSLNGSTQTGCLPVRGFHVVPDLAIGRRRARLPAPAHRPALQSAAAAASRRC